MVASGRGPRVRRWGGGGEPGRRRVRSGGSPAGALPRRSPRVTLCVLCAHPPTDAPPRTLELSHTPDPVQYVQYALLLLSLLKVELKYGHRPQAIFPPRRGGGRPVYLKYCAGGNEEG